MPGGEQSEVGGVGAGQSDPGAGLVRGGPEGRPHPRPGRGTDQTGNEVNEPCGNGEDGAAAEFVFHTSKYFCCSQRRANRPSLSFVKKYLKIYTGVTASKLHYSLVLAREGGFGVAILSKTASV